MGAIAEIFRSFGPEYLERYGDTMPKDHRKVIDAIIDCRTPATGMAVFQCEGCGKTHAFYLSCGNRHCPSCQHQKALQWLDKQLLRQVPGHHFMLTFTAPEQIRPFCRENQRIAYNGMFTASVGAMRTLALDERFIGADLPGFFGVLHTWGRELPYHPHIHFVVPGGAYCTKTKRWKPSGLDFYLPVKALSKIYRAKFREQMAELDLLHLIPEEVWTIDWNVNCKAVGSGEATIRYLSPYVFKVAISDSRIKEVRDRSVTFLYKKTGSNRLRSMTLEVMEFMRRFLQHVLPTGFMKVRYYGFMNPNSSVKLEVIRFLITVALEFKIKTQKPSKPATLKPLSCPECGARIKASYIIFPDMRVIMLSG